MTAMPSIHFFGRSGTPVLTAVRFSCMAGRETLPLRFGVGRVRKGRIFFCETTVKVSFCKCLHLHCIFVYAKIKAVKCFTALKNGYNKRVLPLSMGGARKWNKTEW